MVTTSLLVLGGIGAIAAVIAAVCLGVILKRAERPAAGYDRAADIGVWSVFVLVVALLLFLAGWGMKEERDRWKPVSLPVERAQLHVTQTAARYVVRFTEYPGQQYVFTVRDGVDGRPIADLPAGAKVTVERYKDQLRWPER